jgi:ABC-type Fe3+/spermidine/putrescine transport system ATPase subunit
MSMNAESRLELESITHRYGPVTALEDVSLTISDGELVTLLGPSGCGKTTLLRIIAGFVRPSEGRLLLQGRDVTRVPPHRRPVNMVFQRAALFPHLDVSENVAFGLRVSGAPGGDIQARVAEALRLVRLVGLERRRAHELSGGQRQRVALARALVNRPRVLLLDEPLSALDLRIRLEMEAELRRVHRETGATFVYVTHDQGEALALSDRIVVFDQGHVEQVGTPDEIYRRPATPFAARFVGDANVLPVQVLELNGTRATVDVAGTRVVAPCEVTLSVGPGWLVVRPEVVRLGAADGGGMRGVVRDVAFRGSGFACQLAVEGLSDPMKAELSTESGTPPELGSTVGIRWDSEAVCLLSREPE